MTSASGFRRHGPGRLPAPILVALMAVLALLAAPTVTSPIVNVASGLTSSITVAVTGYLLIKSGWSRLRVRSRGSVAAAVVLLVLLVTPGSAAAECVSNPAADSATTAFGDYDNAPNLAPSAVVDGVLASAVERRVAAALGPSLAFSADLSAPRALSPADAADLVRGANPVGAALKSDPFHRAGSFVVDDIASNGSVFRIVGGDGAQRTLVQMPGEVNGIAGRFEWIVDDVGNLTHQLFVKGGSINGVPVRP